MDIRVFRCYIFADWPYKDIVSYSYTLYICIRRIIHWPPKKLSIAVSGHSVCHIVHASRCLTVFVCTTPDSSSRSVWILAACRKSAHLSFRVPIMCRIFQQALKVAGCNQARLQPSKVAARLEALKIFYSRYHFSASVALLSFKFRIALNFCR